MPYREKKIYSGKMLEIEIYPITERERKQPRKRKEKESAPKQKNLNDKNAKKHLIRLINTNFTDFDLSVHLTYADQSLPHTEDEARRDIINYLRRIKHYRKKNGLSPPKYIAVYEFKEADKDNQRIRIHHHIIMSGMDRDIAEELWGKGRANADRLKADEFGYEGLARYITKDPKGAKRWTQSKNLKQPIIKVNDYKFSRRKTEQLSRSMEDRETFEKLYPGYTLTECKATVNEVTLLMQMHIKMRQTDKRTIPKPKRE